MAEYERRITHILRVYFRKSLNFTKLKIKSNVLKTKNRNNKKQKIKCVSIEKDRKKKRDRTGINNENDCNLFEKFYFNWYYFMVQYSHIECN